jgi:VIT1/CCC1 family predicted Fe2+/Mn2+ transporter
LPATPHVERHFTGSASVRDVVIGMADGLTVPFALAAGLSAAVTSSQIIVTAGLAEVAAGAIAMGLGGYLAARTDEDASTPKAADKKAVHFGLSPLLMPRSVRIIWCRGTSQQGVATGAEH